MDFDLYGLRIFCNVMKFKSFSATAREMHLTQPTISQQIGKLELQLGKRLFERVGHEVIPTPLALELLSFAIPLVGQADEARDYFLDQKTVLKGTVRYAMPESCQWTPHFRKIMSKISEFPEIDFKIGILPSDKVAEGLIKGEYDFGFIVGERLFPELRFEKFADEAYTMVSNESLLFEPIKNKKFSELRFVTFPGWELFFTSWAKSYGLWDELKKMLKTSTLHIGTLAGALHAVEEGAGVGIFPLQCVQKEIDAKKLVEYKKKGMLASSPVYVTKRINDKLPRRAEVVLEMLKKSKQDEI